MQGIGKAPLVGVGDDAYYVTTGLGQERQCYVQTRVGGFPLEKAKEVEKALALQLVAKL